MHLTIVTWESFWLEFDIFWTSSDGFHLKLPIKPLLQQKIPTGWQFIIRLHPQQFPSFHWQVQIVLSQQKVVKKVKIQEKTFSSSNGTVCSTVKPKQNLLSEVRMSSNLLSSNLYLHICLLTFGILIKRLSSVYMAGHSLLQVTYIASMAMQNVKFLTSEQQAKKCLTINSYNLFSLPCRIVAEYTSTVNKRNKCINKLHVKVKIVLESTWR